MEKEIGSKYIQHFMGIITTEIKGSQDGRGVGEP